jgi:5'-phosphate synthase pdxT subunit
MNIGVLALQGAFIEHINTLNKLNVESFEIRKKSDLNKPFDGLILPGGESTAIGKLLVDLDMLHTIKNYIIDGMPVFGTCAGMILLASKIDNNTEKHLGTMDITVIRNAYGRQLGSFNAFSKFGIYENIQMPFIRAPYRKS